MAKRYLEADEETRLVAEIEAQRESDGVLGEGRRVNRGSEPTAVLSVRIPLEQMKLLRQVAGERRESVSEVLKDALYAFTGIGGSRVWYGGDIQRLAFFSGVAPVRAESGALPFYPSQTNADEPPAPSRSSGTVC